MGRIQVLSDLLANKIAAGEVVERPASVIKELLENAIDASSTEIMVEIENGGLDLIRVADNGIGMEPDDALIAFERHATSKIKQEKDLFRIKTLGFRGEALPSIASVSKTEVRTRTQDASAGTLVKIEGGHLIAQEVTAAKKGTEISVRDLFFNTPARLKYLKSMQTEVGHMIDVVNRQALAHPEIAFRMYHNGRQVLQTPGDGKLLHAVASIYGSDMARQMLPIEWSDYDYRVTGAVGFPELNRANRNHCSFFINGRYIRSYQLLNAIQTAYHTRLPINRYPVCVIALELDPSLVDVNVHPNKLEVRFSQEKDVMHAVQTAVEQALKVQTFIPKATAKSVDLGTGGSGASANGYTFAKLPQGLGGNGSGGGASASKPGANGPRHRESLPNGGAVVRETPLGKSYQARREAAPKSEQIQAALGVYRSVEAQDAQSGGVQSQSAGSVQGHQGTASSNTNGKTGNDKATPSFGATTSAGQPSTEQPAPVSAPSSEMSSEQSAWGLAQMAAAIASSSAAATAEAATASASASSQASADENSTNPTVPAPAAKPDVPQFKPIAQALGMYVIAQDETGLYIIDQHAAHEKVLYERFTKKLAQRDVQPLPLLVPLTIELTAAEASLLERRMEDLQACQIEVERFGGTTFLIRSVPDIWEGQEFQALLQELIDELLQEGATPDPRRLIEAKVIMKACKSAIKANQWLSMPEMIALCDQLRELDNPFNCPHGRPIIIHMSNYDLEKQFKRVM